MGAFAHAENATHLVPGATAQPPTDTAAALVPALGVAVIAAFIVYYWLPISGETGRQPRTGRSARPVQRGTRLTSSAKRSR
ncbi:MAG TPA: hypothetical protein VG123_16970, partial [Streptosporangiaceae bacterium]|nr:hypothetical protein [Streptosporangiaceae bacterium]